MCGRESHTNGEHFDQRALDTYVTLLSSVRPFVRSLVSKQQSQRFCCASSLERGAMEWTTEFVVCATVGFSAFKVRPPCWTRHHPTAPFCAGNCTQFHARVLKGAALQISEPRMGCCCYQTVMLLQSQCMHARMRTGQEAIGYTHKSPKTSGEGTLALLLRLNRQCVLVLTILASSRLIDWFHCRCSRSDWVPLTDEELDVLRDHGYEPRKVGSAL